MLLTHTVESVRLLRWKMFEIFPTKPGVYSSTKRPPLNGKKNQSRITFLTQSSETKNPWTNQL